MAAESQKDMLPDAVRAKKCPSFHVQFDSVRSVPAAEQTTLTVSESEHDYAPRRLNITLLVDDPRSGIRTVVAL